MDELTGKHIVILGLARQGKALARFAAEVGARVTVSDMRPAEVLMPELADMTDVQMEVALGGHPLSLLDEVDVLAISGGVAADTPIVKAALERGIEVTNDSLEFMKRTPTAVIGITGSAGKTTTTTLTGVMGMVAGKRTWVGGNIGRPLISDLHKMAADDLVVQELSSFQLEIWNQSTPIAAVLNITPNHLDRHKTMTAYTAAKANILCHQGRNGIAVLAADDPGAQALRPLVQGRLREFSLNHEVADGSFLRDGQVWLRNGHETAVCSLNDIKLRGQHNVLNVLAAVTLADSVGISVEAMTQAIRTFKGVEHRLELVRTLDGVQYINDSIATAPERALAALNSFTEPIILLAGGRDKEMVWEEWMRQVGQRVKHTVLFGELAGFLEKKLTGLAITKVQTLAEAVKVARKTAVSGDVVLLSPGGTSYDAFKDFAERGELFRELVNDLL